MVSISDVQGLLARMLRVRVPVGFPRNPEAPEYRICAETSLAGELLDFAPRVSLIDGLGHVVRSLAETEDAEGVAFARAGRDE
jgi:hypothetical protein